MEILGEEVTESQLSDMLTLADLDKDGRIDYEGILNEIKISKHFFKVQNFFAEFVKLLL